MQRIEERGLDPETDEQWAALRRAALRLIEHELEAHRELTEAPCYRAPPAHVAAALRERPSAEGMDVEQLVERALQLIAPYGLGNRSPRFWGWVVGAGTLPGVLGQLLASSMNSNVFAGEQAPVLLERQLLRWFCDWFGYPDTASGLLVEGCSMANIIGLAVARHHATDGRVRTDGTAACDRLRLYCSSATHVSIFKAAELLGLGTRAVRVLEAEPDGRVAPGALDAAMAADAAAGLHPFCVVANAGTVGCGAIDPLEALHAVSHRHRAWLHVDGAIGAIAVLSERLRPRLAGLGLADSIAFDLHKWAQVPFDTGCVLVRDGELHRAAFEAPAPYLSTLPGGITPHGSHAFSALGPMLGRRDRALPIWMTLMASGTARLAAVLEQNVRHAQLLAEQLEREPELELLQRVTLNIVCFRFRPGRLTGRDADALQERVMAELQDSGFCVLTPVRIADATGIRAAFANHRTRCSDVAALVPRLLSIGRRHAAALLAACQDERT
jgi:glutamate/tyrosine decarboxylase-like PLP-dependent enzyme